MKRQSQNKKKIILGVTGSFGSGKTTVAKIFKSYGALIIDADKIAHALIRPGAKIYRRLARIFGKGILNKNKTINRDKLADIVFSNKRLIKKINRIMHPEIIRMIKRQIKKTAQKFIVLDAPLLIEAGLHKIVDKLIVVTTFKKKQIERISRKRRLSRTDTLRRINAQIPLDNKVRLSDFIIDNSKSIKETRKQVERIRRLLWKS